MTNPEIDFFAFPEEPKPGSAMPFTGPVPPSEDIARLLHDGSLPEIPRRPYDETTDLAFAQSVLLPSIKVVGPIGEPLPKAHGAGTVRLYSAQSNEQWGERYVVVLADRDDGTKNEFGETFDYLDMLEIDIRILGEGDVRRGIGALARLASESTTVTGQHGMAGDLISVWEELTRAVYGFGKE